MKTAPDNHSSMVRIEREVHTRIHTYTHTWWYGTCELYGTGSRSDVQTGNPYRHMHDDDDDADGEENEEEEEEEEEDEEDEENEY